MQASDSRLKGEKFWFCSENCSYPGPWTDVFTRCITCGHHRCHRCVEELHIIRDTLPLPESFSVAKSESNISVEQAEAIVSSESMTTEAAQSAMVSAEGFRAGSGPSLVDSIESQISSDGEMSFVQGDDDIEGYSSVNIVLMGTLSTALARLMLKSFFVYRFRKVFSKTTTEGEQSSKNEGQSSQAPSTSSASSANVRPSRKRFSKPQEDGEDHEEQREDGRAKLPCRSGVEKGPSSRLLACPYYRFDHDRYSHRNISELHYRGCSSVVIRDISRLKQHLYRIHRRPEYYCGSCYCVLDDQNQLDAHAKQRPACDVAESPKFQEKMNRDQVNSIKRRSVKKYALTEWLNIYKILFPAAVPPPPSHAYADSNETVREALRQFEAEGPTLLLTLVQGYMHDHATLDDHTDSILEQALELAGSRLISLMRARFERLQPASGTSDHASRTESQLPNTAAEGTTGTDADLPEIGDILDLDNFDFDVQEWLDPDFFG